MNAVVISVALLIFALGVQAQKLCSKAIGAHNFKSFEPKDPNDPDGFIALASEIPMNTANLLAAYKNGSFPWNSDSSGTVGWYSPKDHGVIFLKDLVDRGGVKEKSLRKVWNKAKKLGWTYTFNQAFDRVVHECSVAKRSKYSHVWLVDEVQTAFSNLHREGHAHSVEVWDRAGNLIGGSYGIYRDGIFSGESVFGHMRENGKLIRVNNAGKLAILAMTLRLRETGHSFIDTQTVNETTASLYNAQAYERKEFVTLIKEEEKKVDFGVPAEVIFPKGRRAVKIEDWFPLETTKVP